MQRRMLGINIDHVATLRQARGTSYPSPLAAALSAERAGADQITVHLREDRRHIQDEDVRLLRASLTIPLNLEMAATLPMQTFAQDLRPARVTLVPERRAELTTEGGLDVTANEAAIGRCVAGLRKADIVPSLFVDPDEPQLRAALSVGAGDVELHTGAYCDARGPAQTRELQRLATAAALAQDLGLRVACGHGINIHNVAPLVRLDPIEEYNIGHSIVADAVFVGLFAAVRDMLQLLTFA